MYEWIRGGLLWPVLLGLGIWVWLACEIFGRFQAAF